MTEYKNVIEIQNVDDYVWVLRWDMEQVDLNMAHNIYRGLSDRFQGRQLIGIPSSMSLEKLDVDHLKEIRDMLNKEIQRAKRQKRKGTNRKEGVA